MSKNPFSIRPMTVDDLPAVLAIERNAFATPWTEANFLHEVTENPLAWNLVAWSEGLVIGFACAYVVAGEVMINDLAVDLAARRGGVARELLRHLLEGARARGCRTASLEVRPSNAAARALYESFGFHLVGRRPRYYADTGEDGLLLARDL